MISVALADPFADHMVLRWGRQVRVYGVSNACKQVHVRFTVKVRIKG